ncbi:MAG: flagellar basal body P-ring formation chaperone FlgA [Rickettsiaceae bacterium]|nr:flagellar basal body P-ring formation chaperone FlgA [Rickettsiaceae bacterium]
MTKYRICVFLFVCVFSPLRGFASYFEDTVRNLIIEKIGTQYSVDLKFEPSTKMQDLNSDLLEIEAISLNFFSVDTRSFRVLVSLKDKNQMEIFGKFDLFFEVLVANKNIKFGRQINPEDVKLIKVKKLKNGEDVIRDPSLIYGMETKTNILTGQIIRLSDIKKAPIIKENDPVTLLYSTGGISIKTLGISLASGSAGEKVRVKNEKTGIVVFGEIVDKNVVKVSAENE